MGIRNSQKLKKDKKSVKVFPSPCGEMGIRNHREQAAKEREEAVRVSVPLRGLG